MKLIALLTKNQENDMENTEDSNTEPVAQTYRSIMILYAENSSSQDVCLFAAQHIHQLLFSKDQQQQLHDLAELRVNIAAHFRNLCSVLWCVLCVLYFKAHFSVIIFYYFLF